MGRLKRLFHGFALGLGLAVGASGAAGQTVEPPHVTAYAAAQSRDAIIDLDFGLRLTMFQPFFGNLHQGLGDSGLYIRNIPTTFQFAYLVRSGQVVDLGNSFTGSLLVTQSEPGAGDFVVFSNHSLSHEQVRGKKAGHSIDLRSAYAYGLHVDQMERQLRQAQSAQGILSFLSWVEADNDRARLFTHDEQLASMFFEQLNRYLKQHWTAPPQEGEDVAAIEQARQQLLDALGSTVLRRAAQSVNYPLNVAVSTVDGYGHIISSPD